MSVYRLQSSVVRLGLACSSRQPFRARSSGNGGGRLQLSNRQDLHKAKRIVVKLGSNVVTGQHTDTLAVGRIGALVEQVREAKEIECHCGTSFKGREMVVYVQVTMDRGICSIHANNPYKTYITFIVTVMTTISNYFYV